MRDPYRSLGVARDADDATIRGAYLALIRRHSPDRDPERFERIREAYEAIKDRRARLAHELFGADPPALDELLELVLATRAGGRRPNEEQLRRAIAEGLTCSPPPPAGSPRQ